jgi:hypothetical protein
VADGQIFFDHFDFLTTSHHRGGWAQKTRREACQNACQPMVVGGCGRSSFLNFGSSFATLQQLLSRLQLVAQPLHSIVS